jgi:hypothetical protein
MQTSLLNYTKLMALNPTKYGEMTNSQGQLIEFYEHPLKGDEFPVIAVSHVHQLAANTEFFDLEDMTALHGEYEPIVIGGQFYIGDFQH